MVRPQVITGRLRFPVSAESWEWCKWLRCSSPRILALQVFPPGPNLAGFSVHDYSSMLLGRWFMRRSVMMIHVLASPPRKLQPFFFPVFMTSSHAYGGQIGHYEGEISRPRSWNERLGSPASPSVSTRACRMSERDTIPFTTSWSSTTTSLCTWETNGRRRFHLHPRITAAVSNTLAVMPNNKLPLMKTFHIISPIVWHVLRCKQWRTRHLGLH